MDLEEFIKQTLISTAKAVVFANKELAANKDLAHASFKLQNDEVIKFDVAVTSTGASSSDVGGKIKVVGVSLGTKLESNNSNENSSRIQFGIKVEKYIV